MERPGVFVHHRVGSEELLIPRPAHVEVVDGHGDMAKSRKIGHLGFPLFSKCAQRTQPERTASEIAVQRGPRKRTQLSHARESLHARRTGQSTVRPSECHARTAPANGRNTTRLASVTHFT